MNPWSYKPWWCQPWSILLTGITLMGGSWLCWKTVWLTILVSLPVLAWMGFFLCIWPQLMKRSIFANQYGQPTSNDSKLKEVRD